MLSQAIYGRPYLKYEDEMFYIGLLTKDELNKTHTDIGVELDYATTLLYDAPGDSFYRRDDSKVLPKNMCGACKAFRELDDHKHCIKSDDEHAQWLLNRAYSEIEDMQGKLAEGCVESWEMSDDYAERYNAYKASKPKRLVVSYECPFLPHHEYMFPIIVDGHIIAVMFIGQMVTEDVSKNYTSEIRKHLKDNVLKNKNFWDNINPNIRSELLPRGGETTEELSNLLIEKVIKGAEDGQEPRIISNENDKSNDFRDHIIRLLDGLEKELRLKYIARKKMPFKTHSIEQKIGFLRILKP